MSLSLAKKAELVLTAVLAACAVTITLLFVRREFSPNREKPPADPTYLTGWRDYAVGDKTLGQANPAVTIIEFADFQCPYCRQFAVALDTVLADQRGRIKVYFRHYPLSIHRYAKAAAIAAECAAMSGDFPSFYHALFEYADSVGVWPWRTFARRAGIKDLTTFTTCLTGSAALLAVRTDSVAGNSLDIPGTPLVIVNGWVYRGAPTLTELAEAIRRNPRR
jgi:protein-disulfide isomerase